MKYTAKRFTVPASSPNKPKDCKHEWLDSRGLCVLCGDDPAPMCGAVSKDGACFREAGHTCCHTVVIGEYETVHWWDADLVKRCSEEEVGFDLPPGEALANEQAAAIASQLEHRVSGLPITELDLREDTE